MFVLGFLLSWIPALAQERPTAIVGAVLLDAGETIANGSVLFRNGKIVASGADVEIPEGSERIDVEQRIVTAGLIDAHTSFGLRGAGSDRSRLAVPERDLLEAFDPPDDAPWIRSGVTSAYVGPNGQNLLGGRGAVVKLTGRVVEARAALHVSFGETALTSFDAPTTRQGMIAVLRQTFIRSEEDALLDDGGRAIASALGGDIPLRVLANTPDDILTAVRVAEEFGAKLVLEFGAGAHEVAAHLAAADVDVVVGPSILGLGNGGPFEGFAHTPANAAKLHAAGVRIALATFSSFGRSVAMEGVVAKSHGLGEQAALRALTIDAASILGVEDRLGSLEPGKDADLVVWEGRPLSTWGEPVRVVIDGRTEYVR